MSALALFAERSDDGTRIDVRQEGVPPRNIREVMRAVAPGAVWVPAAQTWRYPYSAGVLVALNEAAALVPAEVTLSPALQQVRDQIVSENAQEHATRRLIQAYIDNPKAQLGAYITAEHKPPWRHQQIAWHWAMRVNALYLAHKPGLGKSRSYVDIIRGKYDLGQIRPMAPISLPERPACIKKSKLLPARWGVEGGVLIVCPPVVLDTLEEEMFEYQGMEAVVIRGNGFYKARRAGTVAWAHICNYESLEAVEGNRYDLVVADELHYLANDSSQRWARMMALGNDCRHKIGGSGTPVSNMLPSLWAQYLWLDGGRSLGTSHDRFLEVYFDGGSRPVGKSDAEERISQAISRVTHFVTKEEALPDLPPKIVQKLYFPMTRQQSDYYERIRKDAEAEVMTGRVTTTGARIKVLKLLQICQGFVKDDAGNDLVFNSAKLTALEGMLTGSGDLTDRKVVVWCRFLADADAVSAMLARHDVEHLRFQGEGFTAKERDAVKHAWNSEPRWRVLVGMIQMGIGVSLHARDCVVRNRAGNWITDRASTTVFYGLDESATHLEQSMDRVHRGDQKETCLYRFLLSTGSDGTGEPDEEKNELVPADTKIFRLLQEKFRVATAVTDEGQEYYRRLLARG